MRRDFFSLRFGVLLCMLMFSGFIFRLDAQGFQWVSTGGGQSIETGKAIALGPNGEIFQCGFFASDTAFFGTHQLINPVQAGSFNSSEQAFLTKFDANGNPLWAIQGGGIQSDNANAVAVDGSGNAFITGYYRDTADFGSFQFPGSNVRNCFVLKVDGNGNILWANSGTGTGAHATRGNAIATDQNGNCYLAGYFYNSTIFSSTNLPDSTYGALGTSGDNAFVAKYDPAGDLQWLRRFGGIDNQDDGIAGISVSEDGSEVNVWGSHRGLLNIENQLWDTSNVYPSSLARRKFVAQLNGNGAPQWVSGIEDDEIYTATPTAISQDQNGNIYVGGILGWALDFGSTKIAIDTTLSSRYDDAFVAKYDASGNFLWAKNYWIGEQMEGQALTVGPDDLPYLAGVYEGQPPLAGSTLPYGNPSLFLMKLDANGNPVWAYGESLALTGTFGIAVPTADQVLLTGEFNDFVEFDNLDPQSRGLTDAYLLKYSNGGVGMAELEEDFGMKVYPNPGSGEFFLSWENQPGKILELSIFDLKGNLVWGGEEYGNIGKEGIQIDLSSLPNGAYALVLRTEKGLFSRKLLKIRN